jgi:hypothetical protein
MFKKGLRRVFKENGIDPAEIFADEVKFGNVVKCWLKILSFVKRDLHLTSNKCKLLACIMK